MKQSLLWVKHYELDPKNSNWRVLPWELEVFVLISIMTGKEYNNQNFEGNKYRKFVEIINSIRGYMHPKFNGAAYGKRLGMILMLQQLKYQDKDWFLLYRYNFILIL